VASRPAPSAVRPAAAASGMSGLDVGLAVAAAVCCVAALVRVFLLVGP